MRTEDRPHVEGRHLVRKYRERDVELLFDVFWPNVLVHIVIKQLNDLLAEFGVFRKVRAHPNEVKN